LSEQRLDTGRVFWLMRRQRWVVAAFVLIGALIPAAWVLTRPKSYTSTALVLVPNSAGNGTTGGSNGAATANGNITDSALALSAAVLGEAGSKVTPHLTLESAQHQVTATPVATNLVQITASGTSPAAAEALANAVAGGLVVFVTSTDVSNGSSAVAGLVGQAATLTAQVNKYDQEIQLEQAAIAKATPGSAVAQQETELLGSLTTAQANTSLQLQSVNSSIAAAKLNNAATNGGTEVIQHASPATGPSPLSRALPIVIGALVGLLLAGVFVILRQRKASLSTRDEIAAVAGVPVALSFSVGHLTRPSEWLHLLQEHEPAVTELWNVRKVLNHLDVPEGGGRVLTVITLADDSASMAAVAHFAVAAAAMEIPTSLVLTSDDQGSRGLSEACDRLTGSGEPARPYLRLCKDSPSVEGTEGALTIITIVLNSDQPTLPAFVAHGMVMLAVSAGFVGQDQLARVLMAIGHEGLSVNGLIVANPLNGDRTLGALPSGNEQVDRFFQSRALEPWSGRADVR
jgi:Chain length determinant protein